MTTVEVEVEYGAELVENLSCQVGLLKVAVRLRDGNVAWTKVTRTGDSVILGEEAEIGQLYTALAGILHTLEKMREGNSWIARVEGKKK